MSIPTISIEDAKALVASPASWLRGYGLLQVVFGVLGTCGGPRPNANAQVIDWDDKPIEGLYICSNAMSSPTAGVYGGAGGTLGPGMTFGFIAGRHAAQQG